jgi:tight adherence protein B
VAPSLSVPGAAAGALAGPVGLRLGRERRRRRLTAALPAALEQVGAELRGGSTVAEGLAALAAAGGPLSPQLRRVCARADLGAGLVPALASWPAEQPGPGVREAAGALAVAASMGGRSAGALEGLAASLRDRLGAVAEARALSAQARLSAVVVGLAPLAYLAFSSVVDRRNVTVLVGTGVGRACLAIGIGLEAIAAWWMRRIVRVDP